VPSDEAVKYWESTHDMLEVVLLTAETVDGNWLVLSTPACNRETSAAVATPFSCRLTWWNFSVKRGVDDERSMWCDTITFLRTPHAGVVTLPDDPARLLKPLADLPGLMWLVGEYRRCCTASVDGIDELLHPSDARNTNLQHG